MFTVFIRLLSGHLLVKKKDLTIKCQVHRMSFLNGDPMSTNVNTEKRHVCCHMVKHFFYNSINILLAKVAPVFLGLNTELVLISILR